MRVAVVAVMVLAACAEPSVQYAEVVEAWRVARCKRLVRCGAVIDLDTCLRFSAPIPIDNDFLAALDAGKLEVHADVAAGCLDTLEHLTCDVTSAEYRRPWCVGLVTGKLGDGEPCVFGGECISRECWTESELACDSTGCCRGTCVGDDRPLPAPVGGRCRYAPCLDGWCEDSLCRAFLPEGAECFEAQLRAYVDEVCDYGLVCERTCRPAAGTGEDCIERPCRNLGETCGVNGCERRRFAGEPCAWDDQCAWMHECDETLHCRERDPNAVERVPVGAACDASFGPPCVDGAFCDADLRAGSREGICTLPKPAGEPCLWDSQCASDTCSVRGVCLADACF